MTRHDPARPDCSELTETSVAFSDRAVPAEGADALVDPFGGGLGAVDAAPGFQRLEVWSDQADPGAFTMVSWWDPRQQLLDHMRSDSHRQSHDRVPGGPHAPEATRFRPCTVAGT